MMSIVKRPATHGGHPTTMGRLKSRLGSPCGRTTAGQPRSAGRLEANHPAHVHGAR